MLDDDERDAGVWRGVPEELLEGLESSGGGTDAERWEKARPSGAPPRRPAGPPGQAAWWVAPGAACPPGNLEWYRCSRGRVRMDVSCRP